MKIIIAFFLSIFLLSTAIAQKAPIRTSAEHMRLKGKIKMFVDTSFTIYMVDKQEAMDPISINVIKFNTNGNMETSTYYDGSGKLTSFTNYTYNALGLQSGFESFDKNKKLTQRMNLEYDKNNLIIKTLDFNGEKKQAIQTTTTYIIKGGVRTEIRKRDGAHFDSSVVILNPDNTVKSKLSYVNNKMISKNEYKYSPDSKFPIEEKSEYWGSGCVSKYDFEGNMIQQKCDGGSEETTTFYLDNLRNWIEYHTYSKGKLRSLKSRTITYFN